MKEIKKEYTYNFAYCLKAGHQQSKKEYICLEKQCRSEKQICKLCFYKGNKHSEHTIISSHTLLTASRNKLIFPKISQQMEQIQEITEKLQNKAQAKYIMDGLQHLFKLLSKVVNLCFKKEYNTFQTNSIIELSYQLIAYNRNIFMIKEPLSLKVTEFELQIETVSQIIKIAKSEIKKLDLANPLNNNNIKYLKFEESAQSETNQSSSQSELYKPRKNYQQAKNVQVQPNILIEQSNNSDRVQMQIRTRSYSSPIDNSQNKIVQKKNKKKNTKDQESDIELEQGQLNMIEKESKQTNQINNLSNQSALQYLIERFHYLDEILINPQEIQIVERAHEDLGEGSGNTIQQIATIGEDGLMKFWNPSNLKCLHVINLKSNNIHLINPVRDIQYLKRIKCLACVCDSYIIFININNYKIIKRIQAESNNLDSCDELALFFLVNPTLKCVQIYDYFSFKQVGQFQNTQDEITSLAYAQENNKYYYFTGEKNGVLTKYDLQERKSLIQKKINRVSIFYLSTCRYKSGNECIVTFSCNEFMNSAYIKIVNIANLEVLQTLSYKAIDSAQCYNNEIYLIQTNNTITQIFIDNKIQIQKMSKVPSSFGKGADVFNEGIRLVKNGKVAILSQFTRTQQYSNLVKYPIIQNYSQFHSVYV